MDRNRFYFKQKVKIGELNGIYDDVDAAIQSFIGSFNYKGIAAGAEVTENAPQNMTVVVSGPATVFDQNQQRIAWFPNQVINCALDEDGASTVVSTPGHECYLSIFAEFRSVQSDPRVDGHGDQVYFRETESFQINVVRGASASSNPARPSLRSDQILIADVLIAHGQTTITNSDIDTTRTELVYALTGSPTAIQERSLQDVLQAMLDAINAGPTSSHVSVVGIAGSPYALTSGTLLAVLTQFLGHLNALNTVGAIADSPLSLAGGTILACLTQLLAHINDASALKASQNTFTTIQKIEVDHSFPGLDIANETGIGLRITTENNYGLSVIANGSDGVSINAANTALNADGTTAGQFTGIDTGIKVYTTSGGGDAGVAIYPHSGGCAALHMNSQADPPSPNNGDMWVAASGTVLKVRLGGVTRTVTVT